MCEQSSCKCTPQKEDYTSIDYQLSILTAAKEGKQLEVATKRAGIPADNRWVERTSTAPFNFDANCYRIKREPRTFRLWFNSKSNGRFLESDGCNDGHRADYRKQGWVEVKAIEILDA